MSDQSNLPAPDPRLVAALNNFENDFNARASRIDKTLKELKESQDRQANAKYTLFASGLNFGGRNIELKDKNYTDDFAIIFDVVESHQYSQTVSKTQYAAENKVNYSDHAVIEDGKFSFTARISSSPMFIIENNYLDKDTDKENPAESKRPENALQTLKSLIRYRKLVTLVSEDDILENYMLTSMTAARSPEDGAALVFQLEFTEFRTFTLGKTTIYTEPKKIGGKSKQKGAVQSSATEDEIEVTARRTKFVGPQKEGLQKVADEMGIGNRTKSDQVVGTLTKDGKLKGSDGSIIDYNKAVGN